MYQSLNIRQLFVVISRFNPFAQGEGGENSVNSVSYQGDQKFQQDIEQKIPDQVIVVSWQNSLSYIIPTNKLPWLKLD
ncbi:hypothetical protein TTHERM_001146132 (macronuclear) [Tetrahymena thermophila SB210]|uniref:Uncharacterized protein n=1 Tax=Tetrahymena thermophila (strain SB210) TaxID=312017 RepID=W7X4K4_TETTS|nr:hypothetical protein TTHERM_001146132 [Tetrahymena thermophila SB210]EWS71308.1 hypothetical protein TTHERM_001146132 [Tetrahymena thermophila SB210]|eukprot:XP_012656155.1 hypothetical protein TTHERM_001146132 [Tetrahymena thermophila SB210]